MRFLRARFARKAGLDAGLAVGLRTRLSPKRNTDLYASVPSSVSAASRPVKVLLVDDSLVVRSVLKRIVNRACGLELGAAVSSAARALAYLTSERVDVIILDIEMPDMNGLEALPLLLASSDGARILILSSNAESGGRTAIRALSMGASDILAKPGKAAISGRFGEILIERLRLLGSQRLTQQPGHSAAPSSGFACASVAKSARAMSSVKPVLAVSTASAVSASASTVSASASTVSASASAASASASAASASASAASASFAASSAAAAVKAALPLPDVKVTRDHSCNTDITCIGVAASTGGIAAFVAFLAHLDERVIAPILLTQHLPAAFISFYAQQIAANSKRKVAVVTDGMRLEKQAIYLAPGNAHLMVKKHGELYELRLDTRAVPNGCLPSADPMLSSLADVFGERAIGLILSGMGRDGAVGAERLKQSGAMILAQGSESCVVWGMPGAVVKSGTASLILSPEAMAGLVNRNTLARARRLPE